MENIISVSDENIKMISEQYFSNGCNVLYGAGGNGIRLKNELLKANVSISCYCDDDFNKWGTIVEGIPVVSYEGLLNIVSEHKFGGVNVILTSVFSGPILRKLKTVKRITVFEPFSLLQERYFPESFYLQELSADDLNDVQKKLDELIVQMQDSESKKILGTIRGVIAKEGGVTSRSFASIASDEDCYFVHEVCASMPKQANIVDCGGFTGDLMVALEKHGVDFSRVWSFEPNPKLYNVMYSNIVKNGLEGKFIPIQKGVWESSGKAFLDFNEEDIAGGKIDSARGEAVEIVAIDDVFQNERIDFIKMDIEGAEIHALRGGIKKIRSDRPILAISLYHSPYDVANIPLYCMQELENYIFFIRHHSFIGSETVLYGIPQEKYNMKNEA